MKKADWTSTRRTAIPETVPAYPILAGIVDVVPASRWTFARIAANGELTTAYDSHANEMSVQELSDELRRQRAKAPLGPRIAAVLTPIPGYASGATLVFADARAHLGILRLLRTAELGPFTSSEISMLTLALDAVTEFLLALRLAPLTTSSTARTTDGGASESGAFYVLNSEFHIVLTWSSEEQRRLALTGLHSRVAERLPPVLEESVRRLTAGWDIDLPNESGVERPVSFLVVRAQPMTGPAGLFIGVRIDRVHTPNSLVAAASKFHISPRELQVLALLFDGNHLEQIATQLSITSSTVQDHIKSMLDKTESGNRSELIARVLGWESTPRIQRA